MPSKRPTSNSTAPKEEQHYNNSAQTKSVSRAEEVRSPEVTILSEEELSRRRKAIGDLLGAAAAQAKELHRFLAGAGFAVGLVDRDGYLVELVGDRSVLEKLYESGCRPGTRWSEEAIGTSAVAISLARGIAVQVEDEDDYPGRMEMGRTCSAAPIFDESGNPTAVICLVGTGSRVYPHTLGLVSTAAKAIETQLRIVRRTSYFIDRSGELDGAFNALEMGVLTVDREGVITQSNPWAERILSWIGGLKGRLFSDFLGPETDIQTLMRPESGYVDREMFLKGPNRWVHLLHTLKPISDNFGRIEGLVVFFREMNQVLDLVNRFTKLKSCFTMDDLVGNSKAVKELRQAIGEAAGGDYPVLLMGEPFSGRSLAAQVIHTSSARKNGPFITVDCDALSDRDHLDRIFGWRGGEPWQNGSAGLPGILERANGGTVYLTGLEHPSPALKNMFLNLIKTGRFKRVEGDRLLNPDLRIIIGSSAPEEYPDRAHSLIRELMDLPGVRTIDVPPLRKRSEDIIPLAQWMVELTRPSGSKLKLRFSSKAQTTLLVHPWPGNLRELKSVIWHAVNLSPSSLIRPSHLVGLSQSDSTPLPLDCSGSILAEVEKKTIEEVLRINRFNISKAARNLGITRATLYNKLKRYDIFPEGA